MRFVRTATAAVLMATASGVWAQDVAPDVAADADAAVEVEQAVAPELAAQSLRLDLLLGDLSVAWPGTLQGPVWTFEPRPGRELVVLPIALDPQASGLTLEDPAFSLQAARFVGWMLPDDAAGGGRGAESTGPSDAELMDLGRLLTQADDDASARRGSGDAADEAAAAGGIPEGAPRAARSLELLPDGRVGWMPDRSLPGTVQTSGNPPTLADAYRLKLDPEQVRAMRPERPARPARNAGEDRRTYDLRVRESNAQYRDQSVGFRSMTEALRALPDRFEARRPAVVGAVFEANASRDVSLRGHPAGRWLVVRNDMATLGRLAAAGGASRGSADAGGLTAEQAADVATLARVAADGHPWAQRAAAQALAGSGLLAVAGPGDHDPVGTVARRLLSSDDVLARNRVVFALAQLESVTPGVAELLASASKSGDDPAVDAAAVRAWLAVQVAGPEAEAGAAPRRGRGAIDLPAVGRVVTATNAMLQAADGPDAGAVVRGALAATVGAASGRRRGGPDEVEAALIDGVSFAGLGPDRFATTAAAVLETADRYPVVAGGWLDRHLLGSADVGQVEQTLDLLIAAPQPTPDPESDLSSGLPLSSARHALFVQLNSDNPALREKSWKALPRFTLSAGGGRGDAADDDPAVVLDAVLSAALSQPTTPASLAPFLTQQLDRQPNDRALGPAVIRGLVQVTAQGDAASSQQAAQALLGSKQNVASALDALDADGRARFAGRMYDRLTGSLSPVTGLIRADGSTLTRFLSEAMSEGRLPDAADWAQAAGREATLFGQATGSDDALARASIAALAALAGADTAGQLASVAAFEGRRRGMTPDEFGGAWAQVRQVIFTSRLAEAAGDYRLVVTLRGRALAVADGGGLVSDPVLGKDTRAAPGDDADASGAADPAAEAEERLVLGVVELVADGATVRLGAGTPEIVVPDDRLAIRLPSPGDLKNFEVDALQDLPLERIEGPLDLLPDGQGVWSGGADLVNGRHFELRLEPHEASPAKEAGDGKEGVEENAAGQAPPSAAGGTSSGG